MKWRKAVFPLCAGGFSFCIILVAVWVAETVSRQTEFELWNPQHDSSKTFSLWPEFIVFIAVPLLASFGAALTGRALGASWPRSLFSGVFACIAYPAIIVIPIIYFPLYLIQIVMYTGAATATALIATRHSMNKVGFTAIIGLTAIFLISISALIDSSFSRIVEMTISTIIGLLAWLSIPALAGLFQKP